MRCDEALDRMLEADPVELRGGGASELGQHLAGCERCARVAAALVQELDALDGSLESWARAGSADAAIDAALAAAPTNAPARAEAPTRTAPWIRHAWIPLAAAAALTGLFLLGDPEPRGGAAPASPIAVDPDVAVHPPEDRSAAIMRTQNPEITIVWLYDREDES